MILSIDRCYDLLDALAEEYPEELFRDLNGGILLLEDELPDPDAGEDVYIMGEYCWDELGRYINIYYGSFAALLADEPESVWRDELRVTLRHELTHHVEGLAGERSLEYKDSAQLAALRRGEDWPEENSIITEKENETMETITYIPRGVCSRRMEIDLEGDVIKAVRVTGGCSGNLQGISSLLVDMTREEAIRRMEGIKCGPKATSCPDQLAQALKQK